MSQIMTAMSRLAAAIEALVTGMTVDEVAAILGEPRATTGRWLKALRDTGTLDTWSATAVERLARHEAARVGSTAISDSLRPEPAATGLTANPEAVRKQIHRANRKNSSLMLELDEVAAHGTFDPVHARTLLQKTEASLRETAGQQSLVARWRQQLITQLRGKS